MSRPIHEVSIVDTALCRASDDRGHEPDRAGTRIVVPAFAMRNSAFASSRAVARGDALTEWVCRVQPAESVLHILSPHGLSVTRDALLIGEMGRRYLNGSSLADRSVLFSLREATRAMGFRQAGGKQNAAVVNAVRRLTAATFEWHEMGHDDAGNEVVCVTSFHLLDAGQSILSPQRGAYSLVRVRISEELGAVFDFGLLAYLQAETARTLVNADELAARLWMFLESERIGDGFAYHLRRPTENGQPAASNAAFITEITGLVEWQNDRAVRHRISEAIRAIEVADPGRYTLRMAQNKAGRWLLYARRHKRVTRRRGQPLQ